MITKKTTASNFDDLEPLAGHRLRFENRVEKELHQKRFNWKWLAAAASIAILISVGYVQWNDPDQNNTAQTDSNHEEFPLKQAENYYENSFTLQLDLIANAYKGEESKQMLKESLELINELQKEYKVLEQDLKNTGDQRVATAMILNYKSRIEILEKLLEQLEYVTQLKNQRDEKISA